MSLRDLILAADTPAEIAGIIDAYIGVKSRSVLLRFSSVGLYTTGHKTLTFTGAADNGSGLIRLTTATTAELVTGNPAIVASVGGVPSASGTWTITVVDATHVDLDDSTFAGSYTSGGTIRQTEGVIGQTITKAASGASTPYNYLKWGELIYDETGETSAQMATNNDRIIVPSGATMARVSASLALNAATGGTYRGLRVYGGASGTTNFGNTKLFSFHATQSNNLSTIAPHWFPVTAGHILRIALLQDTASDWVNPIGDGASSLFSAEFR